MKITHASTLSDGALIEELSRLAGRERAATVAFNRIEVARTARDHPLVLETLLSGALSPTTARLLARRLTAQNHRELLAAAAGKSKQQVEELLARRFPQADVSSSIRPLPASPSLGANRRESPAAVADQPAPGAPGADSPGTSPPT